MLEKFIKLVDPLGLDIRNLKYAVRNCPKNRNKDIEDLLSFFMNQTLLNKYAILINSVVGMPMPAGLLEQKGSLLKRNHVCYKL